MKKTFVASPIEVYYDAEAEARLQQTNDLAYVTAGGVLAVDAARWKQAQQYERDTWLVYNLARESDRNEIHAINFGGYSVLPADLGDFIELGCGPFTNARIILTGRTASSVTLLDPLATDYQQQHPHCAYKDNTLAGNPVNLIGSPIERWKTSKRFDTLVMVNVLPHCYDATAIFATIRKVLKPGGYLVFFEEAREMPPTELYDVGHPLMVSRAILDEFLGYFSVLHKQGDYFIGRHIG